MDAPSRLSSAPLPLYPTTRQDVIRLLVFPGFTIERAQTALQSSPLGCEPGGENAEVFNGFFALACQTRAQITWKTTKACLAQIPPALKIASNLSLIQSIAAIAIGFQRHLSDVERDDLYTFTFDLCRGRDKKIPEIDRLPEHIRVEFQRWCLNHIQTLSDQELEQIPRGLVTDWSKVCYNRGMPTPNIAFIPGRTEIYAHTCLRFPPNTAFKMLKLSSEQLKAQIYNYLNELKNIPSMNLKIVLESLRLLVLGVGKKQVAETDFFANYPFFLREYIKCLLRERPKLNSLIFLQEALALLVQRTPENCKNMREAFNLLNEITQGAILTYTDQRHDPLRVLLAAVIYYNSITNGLNEQESQGVTKILANLLNLVKQREISFDEKILKTILEAPLEQKAFIFFVYAIQQPGCHQKLHPFFFEYLYEHPELGLQIKQNPQVFELFKANYVTLYFPYLIQTIQDPTGGVKAAYFNRYFA